ncbi:MAG: hypothetical protein H6620_04880 [Halobacteriovoraceae bacterium]|nr:hypothetical protein [Halobacteriovoraceae bacterium]
MKKIFKLGAQIMARAKKKKTTSKKKVAKKKKTTAKKAAKKKTTAKKKAASKKKTTSKKKATKKKAAKKKTTAKKVTAKKEKVVKTKEKKKTTKKVAKETKEEVVIEKNEKVEIVDAAEVKENLTDKAKKELDDLEQTIQDKILDLREYFSWKDIEDAIHSLELFIPDNDDCLEPGCDNLRTTGMYCRFHYIKNWKDINMKREILKEGKLQDYIEELVSKYPVPYIQSLIEDLSDSREFNKVLVELNITDSDIEYEDYDGSEDGEDDLDMETRDFSVRGAAIDDD